MNLLLLLAHSVAEYDDVRMFTDLGYDVFSIGAYTDPAHPGDDLRPALPGTPYHIDLHESVGPDQMKAKENLPGDLIDWADAIIVHHYPAQWIVRQWPRIMHKRVIWRTCGQSDFPLEVLMTPLRRLGLQIVRYSPRERAFFEPTGHWAGQDVLIRFGKYVDDYAADFPREPWVGNITQNMIGRGDWVGRTFWEIATAGLDARLAGDRSEEMGGLGKLSYPEMLSYLQRCGAYLYTGTLPASYTLALMEAMLAGAPVVSIGGEAWMGPEELFEGHILTGNWTDDPNIAHLKLADLLERPGYAERLGTQQQQLARSLFDVKIVGAQWQEFLGDPS